VSNKFYKLSSKGPKVYTDTELKDDLKYKTKPSQPMYLVYSIDTEIEKEFEALEFNLTKIKNLGANKRPISIDLEQLIKKAKI
jgi:hypothetical protein